MRAPTAIAQAPEGKAEFRSRLARAFLAGAAILSASFANFLNYHDYPLVRLEVAVALAGLLAAALIAGLIYAASARMVRPLLEGLLVFLALDINGAPLWIAVAGGVAIAVVGLLKRVTFLPILGLFAGVVLLTTLVGLGERRPFLSRQQVDTQAASPAPAIVHIILDEHIGSQGITDPGFRAEFERFYASRGFRLFPRAYSEQFHTINAISAILSFGGTRAVGREGRTLPDRPTAYFRTLADRGYAFDFYQPDYIDFCSNVFFASCTEYVGFSLAVVEDLPLSAADKARLAVTKFAALSRGLSAAADGYDALIGRAGLAGRGVPLLQLDEFSRSSTIAGLAGFDVLAAGLRQARPGHVHFAHLLFPHYPFVARPDCSILPLSEWSHRKSLSSIAERRDAYHRQLRCGLRKVDAALAALAVSPAGAGSIVLIHGDHGSRITSVEPNSGNAGAIQADDLVAGYSTLFAVRAPGLEGGLDPRPAEASELLQALARSDFTSAETPRRPGGGRTVMLDDGDWIPRVEVPLPPDWQDPPR